MAAESANLFYWNLKGKKREKEKEKEKMRTKTSRLLREFMSKDGIIDYHGIARSKLYVDLKFITSQVLFFFSFLFSFLFSFPFFPFFT